MKHNSKKRKTRIGDNPIVSEIKSKYTDEVTELAESIINTVREPLLILDKDLRVVKANRSFFDFFKVSSEETIGALIYDLGNRQWDIPKLKELLEKILPEKTTFDNYEVEHDFTCIGNRILLLNARQIERVFGKEKIILLAIEDITKRKHLEESLSETSRMTSEYLDILVNHAHFPIIIWDASFIITRFNNSFEKLSGYDISEVMGKKIDFLFPENKRASTLKLLGNFLHEEKFEIIEIDIQRKDKEIRTVLWNSANVFDKDGRIIIATVAQDINERKQAEEALHNSEENMRYILKHDPNAIAVYDNNLRYIAVSDRYLLDYNVNEKNIIGKHHYEVFPEIPQIWKDVHQRCLAGAIERNDNDSFERPDGSTTYNKWECRPWRRVDGEIGGIITYTEVTTERKLVELKLQESEERFRKLFENAKIGLYRTTPSGKILMANKLLVKMLGFPSFEDLALRNIEKNSFEQSYERKEFIENIEKDGEINDFESVWSRKDGSKFFVWESAKAIRDSHGSTMYYDGVVEDITERKLAEEENIILAHSLKSINECVSITDMNDKIIFVNKAFLDNYGYDESELIGKQISIVRSKNNTQENVAEILPATIQGEWKGELLNQRKDGSEFPINLSTSIIYDKDNVPLGLIGVASDITERKIVESELINSKEKAEEMNHLKSNFLANMSHELRTPLVGILGYSDIISHETDSPKIKAMAETIQKSGNRLSETLNLILDLSRFETEKKDIKFQKVELVETTKNIISLFSTAVSKKGLTLTSSFSSKSILVDFDQRAYCSILNNLVNNAVKYTSEGSVTINLSLFDHTVELKVSDTGIGIAKDNFQSIFDEFRQASEGHSRNFEGSGLGLSITKKFVEKYGGTISVDSKVGKGSTFKVLLPVKKDAEIAKEPTVSTKSVEPELLTPLGLLVDDDPLVFQFMSRYLKDYIVLETTNDADNAFKLLKEKKYDLIFMDINLLHGIDGKKAASMIRKMQGYESTPIIAATAYVMSGDKEEFIAAGCSHYLSKPFNKKEIIDVVTEALKL